MVMAKCTPHAQVNKQLISSLHACAFSLSLSERMRQTDQWQTGCNLVARARPSHFLRETSQGRVCTCVFFSSTALSGCSLRKTASSCSSLLGTFQLQGARKDGCIRRQEQMKQQPHSKSVSQYLSKCNLKGDVRSQGYSWEFLVGYAAQFSKS